MAATVISDIADMQVGMKIEAMDKFGKWYTAKVVEIDEDEKDALVHFEGWNSRYDEYVEIESGRLRTLSPEALQKNKPKKVFMAGDRVQAKWKDGRMYFGKVFRVYREEVDVLFDDGVQYKVSISDIRRRRMDKLSTEITSSEHLCESSSSATVVGRRQRAQKRHRSDDSASQTSLSSPPSSPIFVPKRVKSSHFLDDESTETESDMDDGHIRIGERPTSDYSKREEKIQKTDSKGTSPVSSDTEQSRASRKRKYESLRDPYKLRSVPTQSRLSPVEEDTRAMKTPDSAFLAPSTDVSKVLFTTPSRGSSAVKFTQPRIPKSGPSAQSGPQGTSLSSSEASFPAGTQTVTPTCQGVAPQAIVSVSTHSSVSPETTKDNQRTASVASEGTQTSDTDVSGSRRSFSDSAMPQGMGGDKIQGGGGSGASKKRSQSQTMSTRNRAQTMFENMKKYEKTAKLAPKELVIVWDHNEYKCKFTGCNKSFRKESLLHSHIKHYHYVKPKTPAKAKGSPGSTKEKEKSTTRPQHSPKSPRSPHSTQSPRSSRSPTPISPKSPSRIRSILSPKKPSHEQSTSAATERLRRSKSPTESFFEMIEKSQKSAEVLRLLEQSTREQATATSSKTSVQSSQTVKFPEQSPRPDALELHPKPPSFSGTKAIQTSKKPKATTVTFQANKPLLIATMPLKVPLVEIKAIPKEALPFSSTLKKFQQQQQQQQKQQQNAPGSSSEVFQPIKNTGPTIARVESSELVEELDVGGEMSVEGQGGRELKSPSPAESEEASDDVVHCVCGSTVDEGFMIQCEQCLCWQHGDCIGIYQETLPEKYICSFCTNPSGLRSRVKYRFDRDWFTDGTLPNFPGEPKFPHAAAVRKSHSLSDAIYKLKRMLHSTKVKLQAASNPSHPYLKQWAKECAHLSKEDIMAYLVAALHPISYDSETKKEILGETSASGSSKADGEEGNSQTTHTQCSAPGNHKAEQVQSIEGSGQDQTSRRDTHADSSESITTETIEPPTFSNEAAITEARGKMETPEPAVKTPGKTSSPINVAALRLDPLPPDTHSPSPLPSAASVSSYSTPDPKTLKLAPLPPLSSEDSTLESSLLQDTPQRRRSTDLAPPSSSISSVSTVSYTTAASASVDSLAPLVPASPKAEGAGPDAYSVHSENPLPEHMASDEVKLKMETSEEDPKSSSFDSMISEVEFNDEFGLQETSVFAVNTVEIKHPKTIRTGPKIDRPVSSFPYVQIPIPNPSKLQSSSRSAFTPVIVPSISTSSPLHSLLASQQLASNGAQSNARSSRVANSVSSQSSSESLDDYNKLISPSSSSMFAKPTASATALGNCGIRPKVDSNPVFSQTVSSLSPFSPKSMDVVPLGEFVETFMEGEGRKWCQRMLLLDHVEAVQNKIVAWLDSIQKQIQELPCDEGTLEDFEGLLSDVHSTVRQLNKLRQNATAES